MISWHYIIIIVCLVAAAFLIWKENARFNRANLPWRIVASILTLAGLACFILPINRKVTWQPVSSSKMAVWLTEGSNSDSIKKIMANPGINVSLYTANRGLLESAAGYHPVFIAEPAMLADSLNPGEQLHVMGFGFSKDEIEKLDGRALTFHPSSLPPGISDINWPRKIRRGGSLLIQGSFNNTGKDSVKLLLNGLHTDLDSVTIPAGKQWPFQLSADPKNAGRTIYSIIALSGNDTIDIESIPFEIDSIKPVKILLLASSPDFENKYLKNWLFKSGFEIASRTTISRGKYQQDFLNGREIPLDHINKLLLDKFDVLVSDAEELAAISVPELTAIRSGVEQGGLGLIIKADSALMPGTFYGSSFPVYHGIGDTARQASLHSQVSGKKMPALSNNSVLIKKMPGTQPLFYDPASGVYVSSTLFGSGKILLTTLNNTYAWALAGQDAAYRSLWTSIINKAAPRSHRQQEDWYTEPSLPRVDELLHITVQSKSSTAPPEIKLMGINIYFEQNMQLFTEWKGYIWPDQTGWQTMAEQGEEDSWLYIFNKTDWQPLNNFEKYLQTKKYANENHAVINEQESDLKKETRKAVPKIYFFLVALLSCSYLWWEKKYSVV